MGRKGIMTLWPVRVPGRVGRAVREEVIMFAVKRWLLRAVCPAGGLAVLVACCLVLVFAPGPDRAPLLGPYGADDPEVRRGWELDQQCAAAVRRANDKCRLAVAAAEGRLGLLEAAARFRDLDQQPPVIAPAIVRRVYPGVSDEERYCRQVISHAYSAPGRRDATRAAGVARLEVELCERLNNGDLRLPECTGARLSAEDGRGK
jgi:hypothetical protein